MKNGEVVHYLCKKDACEKDTQEFGCDMHNHATYPASHALVEKPNHMSAGPPLSQLEFPPNPEL